MKVAGKEIGSIRAGVLVLVGVGTGDEEADAKWMAEKIVGLRIFSDEDGLMNRSLQDVGGEVLLVSQFTLHGDVRKGRRPSFITAAKEPLASQLYEKTGSAIESLGIRVAYGKFGADMDVELVNQGPVTILLDSKRQF